MKLVKFQITNHKLQKNPKTQIRNESRNTMNQIDSAVYEKLHSAWAGTEENSSRQVQTCFPPLKGGKSDFLELGIWILFVICYLVLGIFYI